MNKNIETAKPGYANGISTQLQWVIDNYKNTPDYNPNKTPQLSEEQKQLIIYDASKHFGNFLTALGVDWKNDPNSSNTPMRVAKAYVNDLWKGRYELLDVGTSFPSDGYTGIVLEKNIPITSMCSHHHQTIKGVAHVAYVPKKDGKVVGLSKLNRVVEHFGRRGAIQEQLTLAIHNAINEITDNVGVMVVIEATHNCVSCRGIKHQGASMTTSEVSGVFANHEKTAKQEVLSLINNK